MWKRVAQSLRIFRRGTTGVSPGAVERPPAPWTGGERSAEPQLQCRQCGRNNPGDSRYCSGCGSPFFGDSEPERPGERTSRISLTEMELDAGPSEAPAVDQATLEALPPNVALLAVIHGPNTGSRFLLDADVTTVGRHAHSDIFLDDVTVSRAHAEFRRSGGSFRVRDVGSLNGTYVNRERIDEAPLKGGDEVQIGKFRLVFLVGPRTDAGGRGRTDVAAGGGEGPTGAIRSG